MGVPPPPPFSLSARVCSSFFRILQGFQTAAISASFLTPGATFWVDSFIFFGEGVSVGFSTTAPPNPPGKEVRIPPQLTHQAPFLLRVGNSVGGGEGFGGGGFWDHGGGERDGGRRKGGGTHIGGVPAAP